MAIRKLSGRRSVYQPSSLRGNWSRERFGRSHEDDDQPRKFLTVFGRIIAHSFSLVAQVVILYELTGAIDIVLQLMMAGE